MCTDAILNQWRKTSPQNWTSFKAYVKSIRGMEANKTPFTVINYVYTMSEVLLAS